MNTPILSIVVPTKNRYEYLKVLINELLSNENNTFEIVVNDNSEDNSEFYEYINTISDERLIYQHIGKWLSVVENCDLAISLSSGKYICMLGDDDGILIPKALELIDLMENKNYQAAVLTQLSYSWPDSSHILWKNISGKLVIPKFTNTIKHQNTNDELKKVLSEGAGFGLKNLPRVYHAIVKKDVLDKMKSETGTYFPGPSPDMANAVGLTKYMQQHVYVDFPIIISGHSKKSTNGQGALKKHHGQVKNQPFLPSDTVEKWTNKVPFFWSVPTIYAESARRALVETKRKDQINYNCLYATCLLYESTYHKEVFKSIKSNNSLWKRYLSYFIISFYFFILIFNRTITFLKNLFVHKFTNESFVSAKDISEVIKYLNDLYKNTHLKQNTIHSSL